MGRSSLEWLCFFIAVGQRAFRPCCALRYLYAAGISAPVYGWFTEGFAIADVRTIRARSPRSRSVFRSAHLPAMPCARSSPCVRDSSHRPNRARVVDTWIKRTAFRRASSTRSFWPIREIAH